MNQEAAMGIYKVDLDVDLDVEVDAYEATPRRISVSVWAGGPFVVAFDADTPCVTDPLGAD